MVATRLRRSASPTWRHDWAATSSRSFWSIPGKPRRCCAHADGAFSLPYVVGALTLEISASIGIACYPIWDRPEALSPRADEAMYRAKAAGKWWYAVAS